MSSSPLIFPETPSPVHRYSPSHAHRPLQSSPLAAHASSSPARLFSSPVVEAQARRQAQYKSRAPPQSRSSGSAPPRFAARGGGSQKGPEEAPQTAFLRERLKARCFERARKVRERELRARRWGSDASSDGLDGGMDVDCEEEDDREDAPLDDELFRRIMANERRRHEHSFRLSYELNVGSSIDPDMEDVGSLEEELKAPDDMHSAPIPDLIDDAPSPPRDLDIDDDELAALYDDYIQMHGQEAQIDVFAPDSDMQS